MSLAREFGAGCGFRCETGASVKMSDKMYQRSIRSQVKVYRAAHQHSRGSAPRASISDQTAQAARRPALIGRLSSIGPLTGSFGGRRQERPRA